jgi:hypothetical protein
MADNDRIYYAIQALGMAPHGLIDASGHASGFMTAHGLQSAASNTTFNTDQVFELGQLEIYSNIEGLPNIEVTAQKVLDGYPLLYHLATASGIVSAELVSRAKGRAFVSMNLYPDTNANASGTPINTVGMSGMYVSSLSYTLQVDGNCTEDITLVGNDKIWSTSGFHFLPDFDGDDEPLAPPASGEVQRREDVIMGSGASGSLWPKEIPGIDASGWNLLDGDKYSAHLQTTTISVDLGREDINELGKRAPYHRFASYPIEITCAIEVMNVKGDMVNAVADPAVGVENTADQVIKIFLRDGTVFDLGSKNRLQSVANTGGDAGGGNATMTYNYRNFNKLTITHPQDPMGF